MSLEQNDPDTGARPRIAVVTLGMHRSGTSAVSGMLTRLGCDAPATPMAPDTYNVKGFYESLPISKFNNTVLQSAGTRWDDWSPVAPAWFDSPHRGEFFEQACGLLRDEFGASPLIVLKDPRISILAPFWFDALNQAGFEPRIVFAYRPAGDVAASLAARNAFHPALGQLIWLRYTLEGERASRGMPRVFVGYDNLLSDWRAEAARIEAALDFRLPRQSLRAMQDVDGFMTESMRHHRVEAASHRWIGEVQDILSRWSREGEAAEDRTTLDRIKEAFDTAIPAFDPLIDVAKSRPAVEADLQARLSEAVAGRDAAEAESAACASDRDRLAAHAANLDAALEAQKAEAGTAAAQSEERLSEQERELDRRAEALIRRDRNIEDLNTSLARLSQMQIDLQEEMETLQRAAQDDREAAKTRQREGDAALAQANAEIERIMSSWSIKVTGPLRRMRSLATRKR